MRFFLIDKITRWEVGHCAEALKNIALSEDFFADHFPRRPVMPGVLILEGLAQLAGLLLEASLKQDFGQEAKAVLSVLEHTKFREMAKPGDTLTYRAEVVSIHAAGGKAAVEARRADRLIARTEMLFAFHTIDDLELEKKRSELMRVWMHDLDSQKDDGD
jgi:3-hydroxyacyl-[acyl-carrier-protein] dehydratase